MSNPKAAEKLLELVPVLRQIDLVRRGADQPHPRLVQGPRQVDSGLPSELDNNALRLLPLDHLQHVLGGERIEVSRSAVSKSVETVSGLLLTIIAAYPASRSAQTLCTEQ